MPPAGFSALMRTSMACPRRCASTSSWRHRQRLAGGDADLPLDEVDAGDHLGDRVLDLQAGVHLEEEELAVLVDELDRAGVVVADRLGRLDRGLAHRLLGARRGKAGAGASSISFWWRRCAEQSRVADPHHVAVLVADDLHLDVARPGEVALDVDLVAAEERLRLALAPTPSPPRPRRATATTFMPRPPPPNAALMATGQPLASPKARISSAVGDELGRARHDRRAAAHARRGASETLSPISSMAAGGGPMNATPRSVMARAKSAFSQKKP